MNARSSRTRGKMVNGFNPSDTAALPEPTRNRIARRDRLLGPAYRLFYSDPVQISRAEGVMLYDEQGNEYLDAYNNVVSVGHCNPRVVAEVHRQMQTLCTHTRYLQDPILDFAEELLATFDEGIEHVMFTCTGSEANDLALRIARHHTGNEGIIVTSEAYHGNSDLTSGFSPSMGENARLGPWVRRVPAPDTYRVETDDMARWFAEEVQKKIDELRRHGHGVAAFIADSLFSSDGVFAHRDDILGAVAEVVRAAGGLVIADEVQSGFARSGSEFWGYQRHEIVPDIVTMGKPMGNGYPVAAVALRPEVVATFGHDMRYFNTFGGNSVAVAAAAATFAEIRERDLQANAARVGAALREGLRDLAKGDAGIGDVRGDGLYIGVEMVSDPASKAPDATRTAAIVNGLRQRRVLISATGFNANVLKIRPPLVFSDVHADRFLTELRAVLKDTRGTETA